jgi:hypothetical protein
LIARHGIKVLLCATVTRNQKSRLSTKSGLLSSCKSWLRADIRSVTNEARASEVTYAAEAVIPKSTRDTSKSSCIALRYAMISNIA